MRRIAPLLRRRASLVARDALLASALLVIGAALVACGGEADPFDFERAPIVLVDLSGLRAGASSVATPSLDGLAAESVAFEWAFTPSPHPGPARAALLTGRYPVALGILADGGTLGEETETLAERLAAGGYRTAAFVDGRAGVEGLGQGFEQWHDQGGDLAAVIAGGIDWLGEAGSGPFFLYLQATVAEAPLQPSAYEQALGRADSQLGELLRALEQGGLSDRAVVVVTADRGVSSAAASDVGGQAAEDGSIEASAMGGDVSLAVVHVPLLLRLPERLARREPRETDLVDVAPTLLDLVGLEPGAAAQGDSLVAVLDQRGRPPYLAFTDSIEPEGGLAVAMAGYRLVLQRSDDRAALYRLADDPLELADLSAREPHKVAVLRRRLEEWQRNLVAADGAGEGRSADDETLEQLRNLGYIQ